MASGSRLGGGEAGTAVSPLCHTVSLWGCRTRHPPVGTEALPLGCAAWRPGLGGGIISAWVPLCSCPAAGAGHRLAQERRSGRDSPASVTENHPPVETPRVRSLESGGRLLGGVPRVPRLPSQSKEGAPSEDKLVLQTLPFERRKKQNK